MTGGPDHARTANHGELNRGAADASGGAVDEQRAAAPDAELAERAHGRLDGGRQRGSAGKAERRRDRRIVGQHRQLGLGRPLGGQAEHAIADGHVRNALAELVDDARRLVAHGLRELRIHQALALLPVARVDPGRTHRNPDLARTRMRIGEIHDLEHLRAAELAEPDCLQHSLRSRPRGVALAAGSTVCQPSRAEPALGSVRTGARPPGWIAVTEVGSVLVRGSARDQPSGVTGSAARGRVGSAGAIWLRELTPSLENTFRRW
jgi:hypothetical protein